MEWEVQLIEWIQQSLGGFGTVFGKIFAFVGSEKGLLIALLLVLFCWKKEAGFRLGMLLSAVNSWLPMIKSAVLRPRPYMQYPDRVEARQLVETGAAADDVAAQGYSFPSMHAASASALYFGLSREVRKKWMWIAAVIVALCVGISRTAVGMHYPTDVLAGWALGLLGIGIFALLEKFVKKEWIRHLLVLLSALPGVFFVRTQEYYTSLGLLIGIAAAIPFERKYVNFRDTRNIFAMILRPVLAFAIYLALNKLMKLPFSAEFLESTRTAAFLVRTVRYAVIIFVLIGIYPKVFPLFEKIGKKKH